MAELPRFHLHLPYLTDTSIQNNLQLRPDTTKQLKVKGLAQVANWQGRELNSCLSDQLTFQLPLSKHFIFY